MILKTIIISMICFIFFIIYIIIYLKRKCNELKKEKCLMQEELIEHKNKLSLAIIETNQLKNQINFYQNLEIEEMKNKIFTGKRVLIGDYNKETLKNSVKILKKFGLIVDIASSGKDILNKIKNNYKCDIIFTNSIYRDSYNGESLIYDLKQTKDFNTPVIICTVNDNKKYFINECNFDDYLKKPLNDKDVFEILKKYI